MHWVKLEVLLVTVYNNLHFFVLFVFTVFMQFLKEKQSLWGKNGNHLFTNEDWLKRPTREHR